MSLETVARNAAADGAVDAITHIALVDASGTELTGGDYARLAVTWAAASNGIARPNSDLAFDVPSGATVGGWRGYTASSGGTLYAGEDLDNETYTNAGVYTLKAAQTGVEIANPA